MWNSNFGHPTSLVDFHAVHHLLERGGHMVHSAVGVDDGVLHEAAVLVDLLLGDLCGILRLEEVPSRPVLAF